jgi:Tat protein secretion system quality control protein TatD with DNase activity
LRTLIEGLPDTRLLTETDLENVDGRKEEYMKKLMWAYQVIADVKEWTLEKCKTQIEQNWNEFHGM